MRFTNRFQSHSSATLLALPLLSLLGLPAFGQQDLEEVIVTGSYIPRPADRPQPITVLNADDLANEQRSNLGEIFMDMGISQGGAALNSSPRLNNRDASSTATHEANQ